MLLRRNYDTLCGSCCAPNCNIPVSAKTSAPVNNPVAGAAGLFVAPVYQNNAQPGNVSPPAPNPPASAVGLQSCKNSVATQTTPVIMRSIPLSANPPIGGPVGTTLSGSGPCCSNNAPSYSIRKGINAITGMAIFEVPSSAALQPGQQATIQSNPGAPVSAVGTIPPSAGCIGAKTVQSAPISNWKAIAMVIAVIVGLWFVAGILTGRKL